MGIIERRDLAAFLAGLESGAGDCVCDVSLCGGSLLDARCISTAESTLGWRLVSACVGVPGSWATGVLRSLVASDGSSAGAVAASVPSDGLLEPPLGGTRRRTLKEDMLGATNDVEAKPAAQGPSTDARGDASGVPESAPDARCGGRRAAQMRRRALQGEHLGWRSGYP